VYKFINNIFSKNKYNMLFNEQRQSLSLTLKEKLKTTDDRETVLELSFCYQVFLKSRIVEVCKDAMKKDSIISKVTGIMGILPKEQPDVLESFILDSWVVTYSYEKGLIKIPEDILRYNIENAHGSIAGLLPNIGWETSEIVKLMTIQQKRYEQYSSAMDKYWTNERSTSLEFPKAVFKNVFPETKQCDPLLLMYIFKAFYSEILGFIHEFRNYSFND